MIAFKSFLFLVAFGFYQDVPLKSMNEFQVTVEMQFKSRPASDQPYYDVSGNRIDQPRSGLFTFLSVNLSSIILTNGETRFKATDNKGKDLGAKKISPNTIYHFDLGFVEDLKKEENASSRVTIYFLNDKKMEVSKVFLQVTKDGDFLVNGEKRGQF